MGKQFVDGYRGRIGLVATAPGNATEADFNRYRPEVVAVMTTRIPLTSSTPEGIGEMNQQLEAAVRMLAGNAYCDVVLCSSTAGSFLDGRLADGERAARLSRETGCRVITSAQCMLAALTALDVRRVTLITPSSRELNEVECAFLNDAGIDVVSQGGFYLKSPREILCTSPEEVAALVRQADRSQSEGVLISCSGLHVMELIPRLEEELGKPVLASNQFGLWGCLQTLHLQTGISGPGRLFLHEIK